MSEHHKQHQFAEGYSGRNPVPTVQGFRDQQAKRQAEAAENPIDESTSLSPTSTKHSVDTKPLPVAPTVSTPGVESEVSPPAPPAKSTTTPEAAAAPAASSETQETASGETAKTAAASEEERAQQQTPGKTGQETKEDVMEKANANKTKPTDRLKKNKGEYIARDPVTGLDVVIKNAAFSSYDSAALDPANPKKGPASNPPQAESLMSAKHQTPDPVHPTNIHFQPYPPNVSTESLKGFVSHLDKLAYSITAGLGVIWAFTVFGRGFWLFFVRSSVIGGVAALTFTLVSITRRNMEKEIERISADLHRVRGEQFSPPTPESVEWLNALLKTVWGLINPDMFISVADMVEDVMQASLPGFVDSVKLSDLGQGTNPVRIVSMRGLPDHAGDKEYPREEWIDLGKSAEEMKNMSKEEREKEEKKRQEGAEGSSVEDQSGDYVNYEVSLSYQAQPGESGSQLRRTNIHLMIEFFLGLYDWVHIPIPIYAVVEGFAVTARLRLQFVQEPPFIRNLTVTLMGVPKVEVSVIPLAKRLPNVLDLPFISGFVQSAIAAAANEYVAPKSMTLNLAQILMGDGVKKDTNAVGILQIRIRHAVGLSAQDRSGSSDPYVVIAYTKLGKPLYSSRIILEDLNPVFEETAFLLVTPDEIQAEEDLSLQLWDSDKQSADDLVGRVVVSLSELMNKPNQMTARTDKLTGFEEHDSMPGEIFWEVGYFDKSKLNQALKTDPSEAIPVSKEAAEKMPEKEKEDLKPTGTVADSTEEIDALSTPPDPTQLSGVLSVIVHHISSLERQDLKGATGDREGASGQDTDEITEQSDNLPSAYCEILLNDDMIYKTRTKQYSAMPFFEAGTERFIRDWTKTIVRVVVRDAKLREHDPILGIVNMPLEKILSKASAVTGSYSLIEGVGFGRAHISILFKSFKVDLPKELRGWDTGTLEILSDIRIQVDAAHAEKLEDENLVVGDSSTKRKIPAKSSEADGSSITWSITDSVRIPTYSRYQSAIHFEIGGGGLLGGAPSAVASLWLQDVADDEVVDIKIPLIKAKKSKQIRQNYVNEQTKKTHEYEEIGFLTCKVKLDSGLDFDHEKTVGTVQALRHNFEAWEHIEGNAKRAEINSHADDDGVIDSKEKKAMNDAHKRELASRHRGAMQFRAVRTALWMKDGVKRRASDAKDSLTGTTQRKPTVESEA